MKLNKMERTALYFFGDDSLERTVKRLHLAAALTPRQKVKKMLCGLADKLIIIDGDKAA